jgi:hypothetical protein
MSEISPDTTAQLADPGDSGVTRFSPSHDEQLAPGNSVTAPLPPPGWYYTFGFVRRGLAGEFVNLFPTDGYFTTVEILRWASTAVYLTSLGGRHGE